MLFAIWVFTVTLQQRFFFFFDSSIFRSKKMLNLKMFENSFQKGPDSKPTIMKNVFQCWNIVTLLFLDSKLFDLYAISP